MSNPKSQKTLPQGKSTKSSTVKELTEEEQTRKEELEAMASMKMLLGSALDFHKAVTDASDEDIRFRWTVDIIKGENTVFGRVAGSSTLPGLLSDSQMHTVTERVHAEMLSKIADPVTGKFQHLANLRALALTADDEKFLESSQPTTRVGVTPEDLAFEAEIISNQSLPG